MTPPLLVVDGLMRQRFAVLALALAIIVSFGATKPKSSAGLEETLAHLEKTISAQNAAEAEATLADLIAANPISPLVFITDARFEKDLGVESIPQMFIIDRQGRTRFRLRDLLAEDRFQQSFDWMIEANQK